MAYTTIDNPILYFSTNLWVADDASSRALTGFGHQPDLVWTKHRGSGSTYLTMTDSVRGGDKNLSTPVDAAESAGSHGIISVFGSDGITVIDGTNATYPRLTFNELDPFGASVGGNYVGWSWSTGTSFTNDASSTGVGTIDSTGSASDTGGFSIVSYTGTGSNGTIKHGLSSAPSMIIFKARGTGNWLVYHQGIGNTHGVFLNGTAAKDDDATYFQDTNPTSSLFSIGTSTLVNDTNPYIAYCFAEKKGYSKFGSYTGNGNADGTFVYTGFKPAWIMVKRTGGVTNWQIQDSKRDGFNENKRILANVNEAEKTSQMWDQLSNGFKIRVTSGDANGSGNSYIYMAFAESPFVNSNGVPTNAR